MKTYESQQEPECSWCRGARAIWEALVARRQWEKPGRWRLCEDCYLALCEARRQRRYIFVARALDHILPR